VKKRERTPWPHVYFDRRSGRFELHVGEYLTSQKGQDFLAAIAKIRLQQQSSGTGKHE
jgi:hypothetical protein